MFILGLSFLVVAMISTFTGKTSARTGRYILRTEDPARFWCVVGMYYFASLVFIGLYLLNAPGPAS